MSSSGPSRFAYYEDTGAARDVIRIGERAVPEPAPESVRRERERFEAVILHGSAREWLRCLSDAASLAQRPVPAELRPAALTVAEVVRDHHRLLQGLSPWLSRRTRRERLALEQRVRVLRAELDAA